MTKDYMMALYIRFCDSFMPTEKEKQLEQQLKDQLTKPQRKQLLRLMDCRNMETDKAAFEAFVEGFRLATGIAKELDGGWYSFVDDEEMRAMAAMGKE